MRYRLMLTVVLLIAATLGLQEAFAAPRLINYQGMVVDELGDPLDGLHDLTFDIYPDSTTGTPAAWTEVHSGVSVADGLFDVILGGTTPLDDSLFAAGDELWLSVAVGAEGPMWPFMRITSVPWAFRAAIADSAVIGSSGGGADSDWTVDGNDMYAAVSGSVGIGTTSPDGKVHVASGSMQMTVADNDDDGQLTESWTAVDGRYGTEAVGYLGRREFRLGNNYYSGVYGIAAGLDGACGVMGQNSNTDNFGFLGVADYGASGQFFANGNQGTLGSADFGVYGLNRVSGAGYNAGVFGENEVSGNIGLLGGDDMGIFARHGATLNYVQMATSSYALRVHAFSGSAAAFTGNVEVSGGRLTVEEVEITGGADLSELFDISGALVPGHVVSIDPGRPGRLMVSNEAYDRKVAGIISGAGDVRPGLLMGQDGSCADGSEAVALSGRVYCWADADGAPIRPGDLLTTSDVPGHAMKVVEHGRAQGAIIGKAMSSLDEGRGLVLVLVRPQ